MARTSIGVLCGCVLVAGCTSSNPGTKVTETGYTTLSSVGVPTGSGTGAAAGTGTGTGGGGTGGGTGGTAGTGTGTGAATTPTYAPCTVVIPPTAIVVDTDGGQTVDGAVYWVCGQTTLSFSGVNAQIILEGSADLALNGGGNTVWLQSNSELAVFADANLFVYEAGAVIDDQSPSGNTTQLCPTITIDRSMAPTPGC